MSAVDVLLGVGGGLLVAWAALVVALMRISPDGARVRDCLRLLPDVLRLVRRLARDPDLPRGVRILLLAVVGYLVLPIDLVPDFIPIVGYADDAIVVIAVLRLVIRRAGLAAVTRHWSGTGDGLATVLRIASIKRRACR